ncbi:phosphoenolpyruvate carboxykinase (ATP) [Candidatus Roizmanbacteria bacterium RIFCSPHIGHO2_02_FULL_37_13b]|uniref:Phosphoenolpyruvate carboxykinase (ATP) n=1 Tax=Candidatus Roizmanbacteria bacterium RIFCSPLOWO2_02_FULL_36_11 TaxID=1802071 RepID=A0A1F7JIG4_9BACT|nr:MAG: phosphoenolpyruvate carboxykinase (ATP) [Candidatus Roizmanbacteria bacterium RIFCSPHIGHO2_02_FULL_37_13b]OGK55399.1 MAG: phosphoenolpyruvate carboxykinase (ATP) [Candidatus Roizmanbacteria bacterium RIFCSPLOWO2_02_FULL_36_11]
MKYLHEHDIFPKGKIHRNLGVDDLIKRSLARGEGKHSRLKVLVVNTGKYTGRSPDDRFIVDSPAVHKEIDWGKINVPIKNKYFQIAYKKITNYFSSLDEIYIFDGFVGADDKYKLQVRVISEFGYQSLFSTHLFRRPNISELKNHVPQLTVLVAPSVTGNPITDGTKSEAFIILNLEKMIVLIGGSKYAGEIKKSVFSVMNYILPKKNVLPMHCSANTDKSGNTALFFGLSGTGKTTLSADKKRFLIGDDEHGWSENGVFNFEGGCYAKCIDLKKENEPQIWNAIRHGSLVENVVIDKAGDFDFGDRSLTENTRAAYPLEYIENAVLSGIGTHPKHVIFLTADAYGVLPPVAKLDEHAAMYHFLSGYTSKLAGTERGIVKPVAVFSTCFGAPFMPLKALIYAKLLKKYLLKYKAKVYYVNTGWSGGPYGIGTRISIKNTRNIISAILEDKLDKFGYSHNDVFNLNIPNKIIGVDEKILKFRSLWKNKQLYDRQAIKLVNLFASNIKKFDKIPDEVIKSGPQT